MALAFIIVAMTSCKDDDTTTEPTPMGPDFSGTYIQADQMGRPAVNTVFINPDMKDKFNTTIPSEQAAAFEAMIKTNLEAVSPAYGNTGDKNLLGLGADAFAGLLATDVLNVSTDKPTTFYDGTNVLTGRALPDDVITVELILIFGGEGNLENPTLSDDHVDANDKAFLTSFPYLASPW